MLLAFVLIFSYLLGTLPTGIVVARLYGVDITREGSGNVGATNVARVIGKRAGLVTLLVDLLKGSIATAIGFTFLRNSSFSYWAPFAASIAVAGHCFSLPVRLFPVEKLAKSPRWYWVPGLKGGKGVATSLGVLLVLNWQTACLVLLTFAILFWRTRIVSLSSVVAALLAPVYVLLTEGKEETFYAVIVVAGIILVRHKQNLSRLCQGKEPKFKSAK